MKFEEEEGALTDSYRRLRAPANSNLNQPDICRPVQEFYLYFIDMSVEKKVIFDNRRGHFHVKN